jgi:hypothetical protein
MHKKNNRAKPEKKKKKKNKKKKQKEARDNPQFLPCFLILPLPFILSSIIPNPLPFPF